MYNTCIIQGSNCIIQNKIEILVFFELYQQPAMVFITIRDKLLPIFGFATISGGDVDGIGVISGGGVGGCFETGGASVGLVGCSVVFSFVGGLHFLSVASHDL